MGCRRDQQVGHRSRLTDLAAWLRASPTAASILTAHLHDEVARRFLLDRRLRNVLERRFNFDARKLLVEL